MGGGASIRWKVKSDRPSARCGYDKDPSNINSQNVLNISKKSISSSKILQNPYSTAICSRPFVFGHDLQISHSDFFIEILSGWKMSPTIAGGERGPGLLPNAESFVLPPGKRGPDVVIGLSVASFEKKGKNYFCIWSLLKLFWKNALICSDKQMYIYRQFILWMANDD